MCGTEEEMREVAGRICRNYLHGAWKTVEPQALGFRRISRVARRSVLRSNSFTMDEPKKVLLRIYGQVHGERAMDAIVTESVIFTLLSERRLGPKLHGVFSGGRIEQYIPELSEPALSMKIAEKMAAIHSMDVPLSKEPTWLWKTMGKWTRTVREERLSENIHGKSVDFEKEVEWLKKFIATVESPVAFCHNDMQE
ncbi:putative choline/ethanolamine kinase, partial [Operophtera brumata]